MPDATRFARVSAFIRSGSCPGTPGKMSVSLACMRIQAAASNTVGLMHVLRSRSTASGAAPASALLT